MADKEYSGRGGEGLAKSQTNGVSLDSSEATGPSRRPRMSRQGPPDNSNIHIYFIWWGPLAPKSSCPRMSWHEPPDNFNINVRFVRRGPLAPKFTQNELACAPRTILGSMFVLSGMSRQEPPENCVNQPAQSGPTQPSQPSPPQPSHKSSILYLFCGTLNNNMFLMRKHTKTKCV